MDRLFHFEHTVPVSSLCKSLQQLKPPTEAEIATVIARAQATWIISDENDELNRLGFNSNGSDPADAYVKAGIELAEM